MVKFVPGKAIHQSSVIIVAIFTLKESIIVPPSNNPHASTHENLERAFAGEAMAHLKYLYFAKRAREAGAVDISEIFEQTAIKEARRAFVHLDLLYPKALTPLTRQLEIAIADETLEYAEIYPKFRNLASEEGDFAAVADFNAQIEESKQHASDFKNILESNARRFTAGSKPKTAARPYQAVWEAVA